MANFYISWVCMIFAVICMSPCWIWHLCNLSCVYALFKSPWITFEETKHEIYHELVAHLHSILWHQARLWLKLFANTVGRFLLGTTSFSLYVLIFLHGLPRTKPNNDTYNTRNSHKFPRKQPHLKHVVPERTKEEETYTSGKRNISLIR